MADDNRLEEIKNETLLGLRARSMERDKNELLERLRSSDPQLIEAYMDTDFAVDIDGVESVIRISEAIPPEVEACLESYSWRTWSIISAYNPFSAKQTDEMNQRRHELLVNLLSLQGCKTLPAVGRSRDGSWQEPSIFVGGISYEMAEAIGICFQQNSIVFAEKGCPAKLVFCIA